MDGGHGNNANGNGVGSSSGVFQVPVLDSPADVDRRLIERLDGPAAGLGGPGIFLNETDLRLPSDIIRRKTGLGGILRLLRRVGVPLLEDMLVSLSLRPAHVFLRVVRLLSDLESSIDPRKISSRSLADCV